MQLSSLLVALAASKAIASEAYASAGVNVDVSANAVAYAGNSDSPASSPTYSPAPPNYVWPVECTSTLYEPATLTITDLTVSTYCPVCDAAKSNGDVYTTTYETIYKSVCPTGLTGVTYTVTQTCTGTTPIDYATPAPGFEVVTTSVGKSIYTVTQPVVTPAASNIVATGGVYPTGSYLPVKGSASVMGTASAFIGAVSVFLGMLLL